MIIDNARNLIGGRGTNVDPFDSIHLVPVDEKSMNKKQPENH